MLSGLEFRLGIRWQELTTHSVVSVGAQIVVFVGHVGSSPFHQNLKMPTMVNAQSREGGVIVLPQQVICATARNEQHFQLVPDGPRSREVGGY